MTSIRAASAKETSILVPCARWGTMRMPNCFPARKGPRKDRAYSTDRVLIWSIAAATYGGAPVSRPILRRSPVACMSLPMPRQAHCVPELATYGCVSDLIKMQLKCDGIRGDRLRSYERKVMTGAAYE